MSSHYKQIDGVQYSRELLELADKLVSGKGDGRISVEDSNELFDKLANDSKYTDLEKRTVAYIRDNYKFTDKADENLRTKIRSWAAERGHANKDD